MTVTNVHKDPEALTMTVTAEFDAPVERVWKLWGRPAPARAVVGPADVSRLQATICQMDALVTA